MNLPGIVSGFLGTGVEFVEALTVVLAVGVTRGWKSAITGAVAAVAILAALVGIIGAPLASVLQIFWVQLLVGLFMLLFGIRWLRKAILRYAGLKALHDEADAYQEELDRQKKAGAVGQGIDRFGFMTSLSVTFLEGLEAIFIVITFGLSSHSMSSAIMGGVLAVVVVLVLGIALRAPLTKVPENTMKFAVGVMLTSFGAFWVGEGLKVDWPQADLSILYMAVTLCLFSWLVVASIKRRLKAALPQPAVKMEVAQ